ncbi:hypothetical protein BDV96DRAFT_584925 [Lophiotrema nucula]|uniref:Uncharacterized protein n=1 Tax=Lophiotrema nucula TaxID=690887 RepID=A0A6A5YSD5_9PLEO|nr:hypothetical protein BDV96DRAFT_584925 [Lophiotrema nucula]
MSLSSPLSLTLELQDGHWPTGDSGLRHPARVCKPRRLAKTSASRLYQLAGNSVAVIVIGLTTIPRGCLWFIHFASILSFYILRMTISVQFSPDSAYQLLASEGDSPLVASCVTAPGSCLATHERPQPSVLRIIWKSYCIICQLEYLPLTAIFEVVRTQKREP